MNERRDMDAGRRGRGTPILACGRARSLRGRRCRREKFEKLARSGVGDEFMVAPMHEEPTPERVGLSEFAAGSFCRADS